MLVLDEADLLLSYGYEEDLQLIAPQVWTLSPGHTSPPTLTRSHPLGSGAPGLPVHADECHCV